jgi:hypothetical protein
VAGLWWVAARAGGGLACAPVEARACRSRKPARPASTPHPPRPPPTPRAARFAERRLRRGGRCHESEIWTAFRREHARYRSADVLPDATLRTMVLNWFPEAERTRWVRGGVAGRLGEGSWQEVGGASRRRQRGGGGGGGGGGEAAGRPRARAGPSQRTPRADPAATPSRWWLPPSPPPPLPQRSNGFYKNVSIQAYVDAFTGQTIGSADASRAASPAPGASAEEA